MRKASFWALLFAAITLLMSSASFAQVRISVSFGPPALPVYEQPACPGDGYIWTPGYWAWSDEDADYYWVPGTWVLAPEAGYLWTPPYWAWSDGAFVFYDGYWGPHVGFYGGIDYGFGYFGTGFEGGRWEGGHFFYNRSVTNVNVTDIHNVYNTTVVHNTINRVSYNGGNGGIVARPTAEEEAAGRDHHIPPAAAQVRQAQTARGNPEFRASANHGKPPVAATARAGEFTGRGAVPAREAGAPYNPPANRGGGQTRAENTNRPTATGGANRPATAVHPKDLPPLEHPAAPNTGNAALDKKYQQQQDKLQKKQIQERQKLQQKQDKTDQRLNNQNASDQRKQQTEQKHQQQTQALQQRHVQQQQNLQRRQAPKRPEPKPKG